MSFEAFRRPLALILALLLLAASSVAAQPPKGAEKSTEEKFGEFVGLLQQTTKLRAAGKFREAAAPGRRALAVLREIVPAGDENIETVLVLLAEVNEQAEAWPDAAAFRREAVEWSQQQRGPGHWRTVDARVALDQSRKLAQLSADQKMCWKEAAGLTAEVGQLYKAGRFAEAVPKAERACKLREETLGKQQREHATDLSNLALLHSSLGDYAAAEPLFAEAREIRAAILGKNHPDHATDLGNLAGLYSKMGAYARAEPLYAAACEIQKQSQGAESSAYALSLNNLAFHYAKTGDFARAEPLFVQACAINKVALGEDHADYALSLNNLAELYRTTHDYARAELLFLQARDIRKQALGETHPSYATSLDNLAGLYAVRREYAKAEPLYVQALEIRRRTLGDRHPSYATSLNNLGGLYFDRGDFARAKPLYAEALELRRNLLGDRHPDFAQSVSNLAGLYAATGDAAQAGPLYREALQITRRVMEATAVVQSERQQLAMGQSLRARLDAYVSFGLATDGDPRQIFGEVLAWKGATLLRQRAMRLAIDDPAVAEIFSKLQLAARWQATFSRAVPETLEAQAAWRKQVAELTAVQEQREAELSAKSAVFRQMTDAPTIDELLKVLPRDLVLIDYLEFDRQTPPQSDGRAATWRREYVAFVVRPTAKPAEQVTMIALGAAAPIGAAIDVWRANFGMSDAGLAAGRQLRAALWEPLLPALGASGPSGKVPTILVSADGALGRLPLAALPGSDPDKYLLEEHRLAMVPVPQLIPTLVRTGDHRAAARELLVLGDVDYDAAPNNAAAAPKKKVPRRPGDTNRSPTAGRLFAPLANTAGEIAAIEKLYGQLFEVRPNDPLALVGRQADEARFRELAPQYRHLHLATHGFFAEAEYESALQARSARDGGAGADADAAPTGYNPGLLSGLALASANREPLVDADPGLATSVDDGILTAQEIGVMNLAGVDVAVLSACETGLGATAGGEGLLGVQRAFQTAGVRTTIASYWQVDDLVTRLLMERFYRNLWERELSYLDSLREAQLYVLNHPEAIRGADAPEEAPVRTSPRFWAAFGLSGDWR